MRVKYISNALGIILTDISVFTLVPLIVAVFYHEWNCVLSFFAAGVFALALGDFFKRFDKSGRGEDALNDIKRSEALTVASLSWIIFGIIASIPFLFNGF